MVVLGAIAPAMAPRPPVAILVVANLVLLLTLVWEALPARSRLVRATVPTG